MRSSVCIKRNLKGLVWQHSFFSVLRPHFTEWQSQPTEYSCLQFSKDPHQVIKHKDDFTRASMIVPCHITKFMAHSLVQINQLQTGLFHTFIKLMISSPSKLVGLLTFIWRCENIRIIQNHINECEMVQRTLH